MAAKACAELDGRLIFLDGVNPAKCPKWSIRPEINLKSPTSHQPPTAPGRAWERSDGSYVRYRFKRNGIADISLGPGCAMYRRRPDAASKGAVHSITSFLAAFGQCRIRAHVSPPTSPLASDGGDSARKVATQGALSGAGSQHKLPTTAANTDPINLVPESKSRFRASGGFR